jgi:uroporphyrinogen decarboxylase
MVLDKPFSNLPNFEHLRQIITRETTEGPVPFIELAVDIEIMEKVTGSSEVIEVEKLISRKAEKQELIEMMNNLWALSINFSNKVGYDYVTTLCLAPIQRTAANTAENPETNGSVRRWQNESKGIIGNRKNFEAYRWPSVEKIDTSAIDYIASKLTPGKKIIVFMMGIFEDLRNLLGFEEMAIKSIEEPDLCDDILENLTVLSEAAIDKVAAHPYTGAIFYADDMGFNTSTMLSPAWMRKHLIPRQKRIADACHKHGKLFLLHSCGNIDALMEDLIEVVGIDARHSYQDNIEPIEDVYKKYSDRIAILGGVDIDLLSRGTEEQVRHRTRQILEACAPGGAFCMGSNNSVTNFCKIENYYTMLDETRKWNNEHI